MPSGHHRRCECPRCWRQRRLRLRHHQFGAPVRPAGVGLDGTALSRPERTFAFPSPKSGLLIAVGTVGLMVIGNRVQREHDKGIGLAEQFDGIIAGMALYAVLEQLRKIHRHEAH